MATKRMIVAITMPADTSTDDLAIHLDLLLAEHGDTDATVWEQHAFFDDVDDDVISRYHDNTTKEN